MVKDGEGDGHFKGPRGQRARAFARVAWGGVGVVEEGKRQAGAFRARLARATARAFRVPCSWGLDCSDWGGVLFYTTL